MRGRVTWGGIAALAMPLSVAGCGQLLGLHELGPDDAGAEVQGAGDGALLEEPAPDAATTTQEASAADSTAADATIEASLDSATLDAPVLDAPAGDATTGDATAEAAPGDGGADTAADASGADGAPDSPPEAAPDVAADSTAEASVDAATAEAGGPSPDGGCSQDCLGGACLAGVCQPVLLASDIAAYRIAVDGTSVYWTRNIGGASAVRKVPLDGGTMQNLVPPTSGTQFYAIALYGGNVYFSDVLTGAVESVPVGGGPVTTIASAAFAADVAADSTGVYFTDYSAGNVYAAPLDGGSKTLIVHGSMYAKSIALSGGWVYWTTVSDGYVWRIAEPGTGAILIVAGPEGFPDDVAADSTYAYWVNDGTPTEVAKKALDGGAPTSTPLAPGSGGQRIAIDSTFAYWTDSAGKVSKVPLAGGAVTTLATGQGSPQGIAVDNVAVYWANEFANDGGIGGSIMRVAK